MSTSNDIDDVLRDNVIKNDPHSGVHWPDKAEMRAMLKAIRDSGGKAVTKRTLAALNAVTPPDENFMGVVLNDPNPANNGYYSRSGGAWVFGRGFPDTFARVALSGSGSAQTGEVSPGVSPAIVDMFYAFVQTDNDGPLTLSIGGEPARAVLNLAGNPLSAGEWTKTVVFTINEDGQYQLIIDAGAAAAAAQSALNAHESELAAAAYAALIGAGVHLDFATVALLQADSSMGYGGSGADIEVQVGQIIGAQGFRYEVAASDSSVFDEETVGGVKLILRTKPVDTLPQVLTQIEQSQARENIGARRSLSGSDFIFPAIDGGKQIIAPGIDDATFREIGNVFYDASDEAYPWKLTYSGHAGAYVEDEVYIFGAKSADGQVWLKTGQLFARSGEDPYVVMDGGTYHLFCEDKASPLLGRGVRRFTATEFEGTWTDQGNALNYGAGTWEGLDVSSPAIIEDGGTWYMFYEGRASGNDGAVGLATAPSPEGPWTKDAGNPIIPGWQFQPGALGWSFRNVPDDIIKVDGKFYMSLHGIVRNHSTVGLLQYNDMPGILVSDSLTGEWMDPLGEPVSCPPVSNPSDPNGIGVLMWFPRGDTLTLIASDWTGGLKEFGRLWHTKNVLNAYRSGAALSLGSSIWTTIPMNVVTVDSLNGWDGTSVWECKRSGFYTISAYISCNIVTAGSLLSMRLLINGVDAYQLTAMNSTNNLAQLDGTAIVFLNAEDTLELQGFVAGGGGTNSMRAKLLAAKI